MHVLGRVNANADALSHEGKPFNSRTTICMKADWKRGTLSTLQDMLTNLDSCQGSQSTRLTPPPSIDPLIRLPISWALQVIGKILYHGQPRTRGVLCWLQLNTPTATGLIDCPHRRFGSHRKVVQGQRRSLPAIVRRKIWQQGKQMMERG